MTDKHTQTVVDYHINSATLLELIRTHTIKAFVSSIPGCHFFEDGLATILGPAYKPKVRMQRGLSRKTFELSANEIIFNAKWMAVREDR